MQDRLITKVSRRSQVLDRIGRTLFFKPEIYGAGRDFFYIPGDRDLDQSRQHLREFTWDNMLRRDIRAFISKRMLFVGAALVVLSVAMAGAYTTALASSVHF